MAIRPVFLPGADQQSLVCERNVEFRWHAGLAVSQKRKSIADLHSSAKNTLGIKNILEISSKSPEPLGVALSAFNLKLRITDRLVALEVAFQSSKVFHGGGPFTDILDLSPKEAKTDPRIRGSGRLLFFRFKEIEWPIEPPTAFYDWLYLNALIDNPLVAEHLSEYQAFTDIEFNPERSMSCQARSAALYVFLRREKLLTRALSSPAEYLQQIRTQAITRDQMILC
jgi:hypothetical protein